PGAILDQAAGSRQFAVEAAVAVLIEQECCVAGNPDTALQAIGRPRQCPCNDLLSAIIGVGAHQLDQTFTFLAETSASTDVAEIGAVAVLIEDHDDIRGEFGFDIASKAVRITAQEALMDDGAAGIIVGARQMQFACASLVQRSEAQNLASESAI